jgi:transketolase
MLRGEIPRLFDKNEPMKFNEPRTLSEGDDVTIFSSGICTEEAMRAVLILKKHDVSVQHIHISTLKPFADSVAIAAIAKARYGVISIENHIVNGGLGTILSEKITDYGLGKRLVRMGIKDTFAHGASLPYLKKELGLDALSLIKEVNKLTGKNIHVTEEELSKIHITDVHSLSKAEAL